MNKAISSTANFDSLDALNETIPLSQLKRQFRHWLGMTPKYFQRIVRVKAALNAIKEEPDVVFSNLVFQYGFSDQSHMAREFQLMANVSPK
ncbi:MAG: helix-turn-helix domain-containing protein [Marinomonas sp.]